MSQIKIKSALVSVYYKDNLSAVIDLLKASDVTIYSTGGTQKFIEAQGAEVIPVENLTGYPSIFGGRVKTLHPKIFGGILYRRDAEADQSQASVFEIPRIDLVIVDLYPFEETVVSGTTAEEIIEKIDIGGISLIRAAAKNYKDVLTVSSVAQYPALQELLAQKQGYTTLIDRRKFAAKAFDVSSHYDTAIFNYFNEAASLPSFKVSERTGRPLRYGENPHQQGYFFGALNDLFEQLNGKELSYNNLVDIDAAVSLMEEWGADEPAFAILKHTNACGLATGIDVKEAYLKAFAADTVSAFGGVLICNQCIDTDAAGELHKLFFEVLIAPAFSEGALALLKGGKNRILLVKKQELTTQKQYKSLLNGVIVQDRDLLADKPEDFRLVTQKGITDTEKQALVFASKICKHTKSNTIVLAREGQLLASGVGQTSRVDALKQAIAKAKGFGFALNGAVMASDAFFPFPDCVEIACGEGICAVVQPGGSVKDQLSIDFCNKHDMAMVFTGIRHFKH